MEISWDAALSEISESLAKGIAEKGKNGLAVIASGFLSNEDWVEFKNFFVGALGVSHFLFSPEPDQIGEEDSLLRKKEKTPNLKGGEALGFGSAIKSESWESLAQKIESGKIWGLYILERDAQKAWKEKTKALFEKLDLIIFQSPYKTGIGNWAHYRLPATSYAEEEGHFTNFEGKVQKYEQALLPLGEALPDWNILQKIQQKFKEAQSRALAGVSR
jgi:predicted molibdopterin-dependent oxidoreductase YjgC